MLVHDSDAFPAADFEGEMPGPTKAQREELRRRMVAINVAYHLKPKCGARTRTTGEPCQRLATNGGTGRCRYHGGATPRGDKWHRPKFEPRRAVDADQRAARKLDDLDKRAEKRRRRKAAMTGEQLAAHELWQRTHLPGPVARRAEARQRRKFALEAQRILAAEPDLPAVASHGFVCAPVVESGPVGEGQTERTASMNRTHKTLSRVGTTAAAPPAASTAADTEAEAPAEAMQRLQDRLRVTEAEKAINALVEVAEDRSAPAPARATAGTALLRAAGFFERGGERTDGRPSHLMTALELDRAVKLATDREAEAQQRVRTLEAEAAVDDGADDSIFD